MVTTHSVEDSGLLESLTAAFHDAHPDLRLSTTAVGSGAALAMGRRGDGDVLLTHDPAGEAIFMAEGHGYDQGPVMEAEFLIAGPPADPASIAGWTDAVAAVRAVAAAEARFLSRGDDSGTHAKGAGALASGRPGAVGRPARVVHRIRAGHGGNASYGDPVGRVPAYR